jgi:regulator of protease activity HflC (stomatin/prohibitin superfamily)
VGEAVNNLGGNMRTRLIALGVLAVIAIIVIANTVLVVDAGELAVIFNQLTGGLSARDQGTHLLLPGFQKPVIYDGRVQTFSLSGATSEGEARGDESLDALTKDGQVVKLDVSVRFHIDKSKVTELHQHIGTGYIDKVVRPQVRNILRIAVASYPVTEVYTEKRIEVQNRSAQELESKFKANYLVLDEVLIRKISFSPEFQRAIELKQIAQQDSQRMQYVLEKEKQEKERKIIEAQGEAESIRLKGVALANNPALIQYEYVQKITPGIQTIITDGKSILSLGDIVKKE